MQPWGHEGESTSAGILSKMWPTRVGIKPRRLSCAVARAMTGCALSWAPACLAISAAEGFASGWEACRTLSEAAAHLGGRAEGGVA